MSPPASASAAPRRHSDRQHVPNQAAEIPEQNPRPPAQPAEMQHRDRQAAGRPERARRARKQESLPALGKGVAASSDHDHPQRRTAQTTRTPRNPARWPAVPSGTLRPCSWDLPFEEHRTRRAQHESSDPRAPAPVPHTNSPVTRWAARPSEIGTLLRGKPMRPAGRRLAAPTPSLCATTQCRPNVPARPGFDEGSGPDDARRTARRLARWTRGSCPRARGRLLRRPRIRRKQHWSTRPSCRATPDLHTVPSG